MFENYNNGKRRRPMSLTEIFAILNMKPKEKNGRIYNSKECKMDINLDTIKGESDHPEDK